MRGRGLSLPVGVGPIATRLLLIGLGLVVVAFLELRGGSPYSERAFAGLYTVILCGFLWTLGYGLLARAGRMGELPWIELVGDGLLASGLLYCTGGAASLFGFLYVGWIVYATLRLGRVGAIVSTLASIGGFGILTWATVQQAGLHTGPPISSAEGVEVFSRHAAAFLLVGVLAQRLGRELSRRGAQLRELSELHRRIVDHMPSGLLTIDPRMCVASFNQEAEQITGYAAPEVIGRAIGWLFPDLTGLPRIGAQDQENEDDRSPGERRARLRFTYENPEGELRHLGFSHATLRDDAGRSEGTVLIFQDLTRIVEMEEQLRRSERLASVGQLAAGLAHEIRNPLASLSGSIELLEAELPDLKSDGLRLVRIVYRETERLNRLLTEFLHFARPSPGKSEPVHLEELLRGLSGLLAAGAETSVTIEHDVPDSLAILGDPDRLRQVFWNLLLNAAEAEPVDGRIFVCARELAEEEIEVCIEDHGRGIPEQLLPQIFDPFFTTKANGTGLGLSTVHGIVEAHGGRTQVISKAGKGTTVKVVLPAVSS